MDPVSVGHAVSRAGWTVIVYLLLAGGSIFACLRLLRAGAKPTPQLRAERGLRQQYPSPEDPTETDIDIIAIHGLDTESPDTWTWRGRDGEQINWLTHPDMLPRTAGSARIFTYDWPADLLRKSVSIPLTITELARLLLEDIDSMRRHLAADGRAREDRPVLFRVLSRGCHLDEGPCGC